MGQAIREILIDARKKIESPDRWTQGVLSRNKIGNYEHPRSHRACQWCAAGAVVASAGFGSHLSGLALRALADVIDADITEFNDDRTHAEVLEVFDKAIAAQDI